MTFSVVALYRFVSIPEPAALRDALASRFADLGLRGTLLVAPEGVNGTLAGTREAVEAALDTLDASVGIREGEIKFSRSAELPFRRLRVRLKREIITMRALEADPTRQVGTYVEAADWNAVLADPDVLVLDTRNRYETRAGTFAGAVDPDIATFTEFKDYVARELDPSRHRTVAMFCTGGIRCEKASSYMLAHGFERVLHLRGGILRYLEDVPAAESRWQGDCYVFDDRTALAQGLEQTEWRNCFGCGAALSAEERTLPSYEPGVSCPHCIEGLDATRARSLRMRHAQITAERALS